MKPVDVVAFTTGIRGRPLKAFIEYKLQRMDFPTRVAATRGTLNLVPEMARRSIAEVAQAFASRSSDPAYWETDCSTLYHQVATSAEKVFVNVGAPFSDQDGFNAFELLALELCPRYESSFGPVAANPRPSRVGLMSRIALLYPIAAAVWLSQRGDVTLRVLSGYSLANLGYVLFAAGLFAGSFRVLGLHSRGPTLVAGVIAWVVGTAIINL